MFYLANKTYFYGSLIIPFFSWCFHMGKMLKTSSSSVQQKSSYWSWGRKKRGIIKRSHGFGWDRINVLCRGSHNTVFWIFDENCGDNTLIFFSCCRAVLKQSQGLFCFLYCPTSKEAGGTQEVGNRHSQDSWPRLTKDRLCTMRHHIQQ